MRRGSRRDFAVCDETIGIVHDGDARSHCPGARDQLHRQLTGSGMVLDVTCQILEMIFDAVLVGASGSGSDDRLVAMKRSKRRHAMDPTARIAQQQMTP